MEDIRGLERIQEAVLAEAASEARRIVDAAEKACAERVREEGEKNAREAERAFDARRRIIDEELEREIVLFRIEASRKVLARQNEILEDIYEAALGEILRWPADEYAALMRRLLDACAGPEAARLRVHPDDEPLFLDMLEAVNSSRTPENRISIDRDHPLGERGGFILVAGDYEIDSRLRTVMDDVRRETTPEISRRLFA